MATGGLLLTTFIVVYKLTKMRIEDLIEQVVNGESPADAINEAAKKQLHASKGDKFIVVTSLRTSAGRQPRGMKFEIAEPLTNEKTMTIKFLIGGGMALVDTSTLVNAIAKGDVKRIQ